MLYIPSFIKIGSGIQKLIGGAQTAWWSHKHKKLKTKKTELRGFSPQANYTEQATAACRRS
jgi:hypothetical protein